MPMTPQIRDVGLTGLLVTFAPKMSEAANRAALALRAEIQAQGWDGVTETASTLTSAFVGYDPLNASRDGLAGRLAELLDSRDWTEAPLPEGRRRWTIPVVLGGDAGPQFAEAAEAAGRTEAEAAEDIAAASVRVLTLGFAPGQGYLGELPEAWAIPRMGELNPKVPAGALVTAIRQLIVFANAAPTGWRHIGQTGFRSYRPEAEDPFPLTPGDEVRFEPVAAGDLERLREDPEGGAVAERIG